MTGFSGSAGMIDTFNTIIAKRDDIVHIGLDIMAIATLIEIMYLGWRFYTSTCVYWCKHVFTSVVNVNFAEFSKLKGLRNGQDAWKNLIGP